MIKYITTMARIKTTTAIYNIGIINQELKIKILNWKLKMKINNENQNQERKLKMNYRIEIENYNLKSELESKITYEFSNQESADSKYDHIEDTNDVENSIIRLFYGNICAAIKGNKGNIQ